MGRALGAAAPLAMLLCALVLGVVVYVLARRERQGKNRKK